MRKLIARAVSTLALLMASTVIAQGFNKGFEATQHNDFATAMRERKPLADMRPSRRTLASFTTTAKELVRTTLTGW